MAKNIKLEISTNVYPEPLVCMGVKDESYDFLSYEWTEKRDGETPSKYLMKYSKTTKQIFLTRKGEITSELVFEQGKETKGKFVTPYGDMEFTILTDMINLPNMFSPRLELGYRMLENQDMDRNTFIIREIV